MKLNIMGKPKKVNNLLKYDSKQTIGTVKERFEELKYKGWDWRSFYNGWLEGRTELLNEKLNDNRRA